MPRGLTLEVSGVSQRSTVPLTHLSLRGCFCPQAELIDLPETIELVLHLSRNGGQLALSGRLLDRIGPSAERGLVLLFSQLKEDQREVVFGLLRERVTHFLALAAQGTCTSGQPLLATIEGDLVQVELQYLDATFCVVQTAGELPAATQVVLHFFDTDTFEPFELSGMVSSCETREGEGFLTFDHAVRFPAELGPLLPRVENWLKVLIGQLRDRRDFEEQVEQLDRTLSTYVPPPPMVQSEEPEEPSPVLAPEDLLASNRPTISKRLLWVVLPLLALVQFFYAMEPFEMLLPFEVREEAVGQGSFQPVLEQDAREEVRRRNRTLHRPLKERSEPVVEFEVRSVLRPPGPGDGRPRLPRTTEEFSAARELLKQRREELRHTTNPRLRRQLEFELFRAEALLEQRGRR